jgi:tetratricopeptide (TPR) repeat protein
MIILSSFFMTKFYNLAADLVTRSRYDLAESLLLRSLAEDPQHALSHSLLGICLAHLKKPKEALAAVNEGLRLNPELAYAHFARGRVYSLSKELRWARREYEAAIRLDPTMPEYYFLLACVCSDLRQTKESLAQADRGLQLNPNHTGCASLRALALQQFGFDKEAEAAIARALTLNPNNDFTHTAQGWRLLQKYRRKAARSHFLEALRINPENRWARCGLAHANEGFSRAFLEVGRNPIGTTATGRVLRFWAWLVVAGLLTIVATVLWIRQEDTGAVLCVAGLAIMAGVIGVLYRLDPIDT